MKSAKRIITLLVAVLVLTLGVSGALAADNVSVDAGKTATLTFTFSDIYNVDGEFTVSDPKSIVSNYTVSISNAGATAATVSGSRLWASPGAEPVRTTVVVKVEVAVKSGAVGGSTCTVNFSGIYGDANKPVGNEQEAYQSATVTVKGSAAPQPTTSTKPTPSVSPSPSPSPSGQPGVDYTELNNQITIAEGLDPTEYDNASREILVSSLEKAREARSSKDQSAVSAAAKELKNALSLLKKMDYTKLESALSRADTLLVSEQTSILWQKLADVSRKATGMLESGDQEAVDAVVAELTEILDALKKELETIQQTQVVVKEVPVDVLPSSDYCNIQSHHLWPAFFIASLVINVLLLGVVAFMTIRRIRNQKDDMPLVDYDIDEDF